MSWAKLHLTIFVHILLSFQIHRLHFTKNTFLWIWNFKEVVLMMGEVCFRQCGLKNSAKFQGHNTRVNKETMKHPMTQTWNLSWKHGHCPCKVLPWCGKPELYKAYDVGRKFSSCIFFFFFFLFLFSFYRSLARPGW